MILQKGTWSNKHPSSSSFFPPSNQWQVALPLPWSLVHIKQGAEGLLIGGHMENNQQRCIFRGAIAGLLSVHIFKLTKIGQTVFQSDCFQSKGPYCSTVHPLQNLISADPFIFMNLLRDVMIPLCGFTFHFPITKMTENVFMFLGHLDLSLCEVPFKVFYPNFYWLSFSSWFIGVTYILDYILWILGSFPVICFTNIVTQVVSYILTL